MSIKLIGTTSGVEQDVDASKAARVVLYDSAGNPIAYDTDFKLVTAQKPNAALGHYSVAGKTGAITATLAANSTLFSMRWSDATRFAIIERIAINAYTVGPITASVAVDFDLIFARSFTVADSGGVSLLPAANMNERRTSMGTTLFNDIRIANTGTLTVGTRTLDTNPIRKVFGVSGTAALTRWFLTDMPLIWDSVYGGGGQHPLILAQNEGIVIRNNLVGPATGTFVVYFCVDFAETTAY